MLNQEAAAAVAGARLGPQFVRPIYGGYSFGAIPATVESLFGLPAGPGLPPAALAGLAGPFDAVVVLLVDALGWRFVEPRLAEDPFLRRFLEGGVVSPLTSLFPSTTSAHVTAMHTGRGPGASGIYEWFMYEPALDAIIAPLLFALAEDEGRETLAARGHDPALLLAGDTLYQRLAAAGVGASAYQHRSYARSSYSSVAMAGARLRPYNSLSELLSLFEQDLASRRGPAYYYLYYDVVDSAAHSYGPGSAVVAAEIDATLLLLERQLMAALSRSRGRTLLLVTADHGQIAFDPTSTLMVNDLVPELDRAVLRGAGGRPLAPAGSPRDLFMHVQGERLEDLAAALRAALAGRAEVYTGEELIGAGLFGPAPGPRLRERLGNLAVLPYAGQSVWWRGAPIKREFRGMHGGLCPEEALTQVLALAI